MTWTKFDMVILDDTEIYNLFFYIKIRWNWWNQSWINSKGSGGLVRLFVKYVGKHVTGHWAGYISSLVWFLSSLFQICAVEKVAEQEQIGKVDEEAEAEIVVAHKAFTTVVLYPKSPAVNHHTHDHLSNLATGNGHHDPCGHVKAKSSAGIVAVHDRVNAEVNNGKIATGGADVMSGIPAVDENSGVVIPMQKDELLFAYNDPERVE